MLLGLASLLALGLALLLSGCFAIDGTRAEQAPLGDVQLEFRICTRSAPDCPAEDSAPLGQTIQMLVAVLLPANASPVGPPQFLDPVGHGGWLAVDACFRPSEAA